MAALQRVWRHSTQRLAPRLPSHSRVAFVSVTRQFATAKESSLFDPLDTFADRHIGPNDHEVEHMLSKLGYNSMDSFVDAAIPTPIRLSESSVSDQTIPSLSESELFKRAKALASENKPFKSYIGMGYHNAVVPPVILRNVRTRIITCSSS